MSNLSNNVIQVVINNKSNGFQECKNVGISIEKSEILAKNNINLPIKVAETTIRN